MTRPSGKARRWIGASAVLGVVFVTLLVLARGPGPGPGRSTTADGGAVAADRVEPVRLVLEGPLRGVVRDEEGVPVPRARVMLLPGAVAFQQCEALLEGCQCDDTQAELATLERALTVRAETVSDEQGRFPFDARAAFQGDRLVAIGGHLGGATRELMGEEVVITATDRWAVVLDGEVPQTGVVVLGLVDSRVAWLARSAEGGGLVVPDADELMLLAPGFVPSGYSFLESQLHLERGVYFSGTVRSEKGPRAGLRVEAALEQDDAPSLVCSWTDTAVDGTWRLGPLRTSREYRISVRDGDLRAATLLHANVRQPETDSDLDLTRPAVVLGVVKDSRTGQPVAGAAVVVRSTGHEHEGHQVTIDEARVVCDATGHFEAQVIAGAISVTAAREGYEESNRFGVQRVLAPGERVELMLELTPVDGVRGRVVDEAGRPVEGASVGCSLSIPGSWVSKGAVSDAVGRFQVDCGVGEVTLTAGGQGRLSVSKTTRSPSSGVVLTLQRGVAVKGKVIDETGAPVPHLDVEVRGEDGMERASTERDGTFVIEGGLTEGHWVASVLEIDRDDEDRPSLPMTRLFAKRFAELGFDVRAGGAPFLLLKLGPARVLHGRAVLASGAPAPGLDIHPEPGEEEPETGDQRVAAFALSLASVGGELNKYRAETRTAADGTFTLKSLGPGPWTLRATSDDSRDDPRFPTVVRDNPSTVTLRVVGLPSVRGKVLDVAGTPLADFTVLGRRMRSPDGAFSVSTPLAGVLDVRVLAPGHAPAQKEVRVGWGETVDVGEIRLSPGRVLKVRTLDALTGAAVRANFYADGVFLTRDEKKETLEGVPVGDTTLRVTEPRHVASLVQVPAGLDTLTVRLERGARVLGVFAGPPEKRAVARLLLPAGEAAAFLENGRFEFVAVPTGRFPVRVLRSKDQVLLGEAVVTVPATGEATVTVPPK